MTLEQASAFGVLLLALAMFVWGRWRYDLVAMSVLLICVLIGIVPASQAFSGFAHPAVVTVAAVLIISRALQNAGIVDIVARLIAPLRGHENLQLAAQTVAIAVLSAFMNNVGALALLLPVALQNAYRNGYSPARSLMPLAFGALLGGLTTLIGTPPNIIISSYRERELGDAYGMFDFTPVGGAVALAGLAFVVLAGWRLLPRDRRGAVDRTQLFSVGDYLTEASVPAGSKAARLSVRELEAIAEDEVTVAGVIRQERRLPLPQSYTRIEADDVLVLRGDPVALKTVVDGAGLELVGDEKNAGEVLRSEEVKIIEAIVRPGSRLVGRTAGSLRLRTYYDVNLLAVARHGRPIKPRLGDVRLQVGDVVLLQGPAEQLDERLAGLGCLPLAERDIRIGQPRRLAVAGTIFVLGIAAVMAGLMPAAIVFLLVAAGMVLLGVLKPDEAYTSIEWSVIVLLAAMLPVGMALETTGVAALIAGWLLAATAGLAPAWILLLLLVTTMFLSDVINNNATAVIMAPVGIAIAERMQVSVDPFLMAIAIGASCAFLTPIGHQCNTLVLEPGGYRFGDYWRMGLPLEIVIAATAVPLILLVWPL